MIKRKNFHLPSILFLVLINNNLHAQSISKWGISAAFNSVDAQLGDPEWNSWGYAKGNFQNFGDIRNKSVSLSLVPKYSIKDNVFLRFELGVTNFNLTSYYDANAHLTTNNSTSTIIITQSIKQKVYRFIPGIQWNLLQKKPVEFHCGMNGSFLYYSDMKYRNRSETKNLQSNAIMDGFEDNATATGGFAVGIGAFAGFNVYLSKHISVGAESSFSLLYYNLGNTFGGASIPLIDNPSGTQVYSYKITSYKGLQFSRVLPSINVAAWF